LATYSRLSWLLSTFERTLKSYGIVGPMFVKQEGVATSYRRQIARRHSKSTVQIFASHLV